MALARLWMNRFPFQNTRNLLSSETTGRIMPPAWCASPSEKWMSGKAPAVVLALPARRRRSSITPILFGSGAAASRVNTASAA